MAPLGSGAVDQLWLSSDGPASPGTGTGETLSMTQGYTRERF